VSDFVSGGKRGAESGELNRTMVRVFSRVGVFHRGVEVVLRA
jgi:hypothetical protein